MHGWRAEESIDGGEKWLENEQGGSERFLCQSLNLNLILSCQYINTVKKSELKLNPHTVIKRFMQRKVDSKKLDVFSPLFGLPLLYSVGLVNVSKLRADVTLCNSWVEVAKIQLPLATLCAIKMPRATSFQ